ncbi:MAG: putative sugar nucleotidyl transferase [Candidatus Zixiibacteriota bacterium]
MSLTVCFYEDSNYINFYPLTHLRPAYCLRAGIVPLYRRAERFFKPTNWAFLTRTRLAGLTGEQFREIPVNIIKRHDSDVLFINGRIRDYGNLPELVKSTRLTTVFKNSGETVAVLFQNEILQKVPPVATVDMFLKIRTEQVEEIAVTGTSATLYNHLWELVEDIEPSITADFEYLRPTFNQKAVNRVHAQAALVAPDRIHLDGDVEIQPGAVLDASHGPIYIGPNSRVEAHTAIFGPCFIGANSVAVAGKITGSSIGHTCRVGGEVEESIFHAYVNKYHAGFIGHSYVGPWVNFGAMTTNSDLKNNYSNIRVTLNGESVDTGSIKVGSFIGDHTKFGIGTLLNTGINIGVCCNIFGGTLVTDKEVLSFQWGNSQGYQKYLFAKALETARRTAERRHTALSGREEEVLKDIYDGNASGDGVINF